MKATYVKDLPTHLDAILVAIDTADFATIIQMAISLEKAAGQISDSKIAELAAQLRGAAEKSSLEVCVCSVDWNYRILPDTQEVEKITEQLKTHLEQVSL